MEDTGEQSRRRHDGKGNVAKPTKRRVLRVAGIGFLCLLPLILIMSGRLHLMIGCLRRWQEEQDLITENYTKVVEERDVLIANYTKAVEERDILDQLMGVWKSFNSSQYFFSVRLATWDEAREDCRRRGADLVIINSQEEQNVIFSFQANLSATARDFWIGLSDREQENEWKWVDGSRHNISEGLWMLGEPNNDWGYEHCAKAVRQEWNDQGCFYKFIYTFEKPN